MQKLKAELHCHASEDPYDRLDYSAKELLDMLAMEGFEVVALTLHGSQHYPEDLKQYADERGILLIPGVEAFIGKKHTLLYNFDYHPRTIRTFDDIRRHKRSDSLVIAPHPYYPDSSCLWSDLDRHADIFDAIEYCHFHSHGFNFFNRLAVKKAKALGLPVVGTSDIHTIGQIGQTYSILEAEKSITGVIDAVKKKRVEVVSNPLSVTTLLRTTGAVMAEKTRRLICGGLAPPIA
ncbi:MAG TPA: PHP-associated domain-containing protein [Blastocatellia bacterium]|nr:PHP-associated domain-containing protein [Blastocatellia bacterium]